MADSRLIDAVSEQSRMETGRANFNTFWQDVADRVDPAAGNFIVTRTPGTQVGDKQFDSTASIALSRAVAAYESLCTPRTQKWQGLVPPPGKLRDSQPIKIYLEAFRDLLFQVRYAPRANFANQNSGFIRQFLNYGNGVLYVDDDPGRSLRYKHIGLAESFFAEDHAGFIDRFHRKFKLKARQLAQKFPKADFPMTVRNAIEKQPDMDFDVLHRVCPNYDRDMKRGDYAGMAITGTYFLLSGEQVVLNVEGYRTMPYLVSRYRVNPGEIYGRGPVMDMLADIKTVNEQQKTNLRVGQRTADKPLLAYRDGLSAPLNLRGGVVNYGGLNDRGEALVKPLDLGGDLPVSLEMQEATRKIIRDGLFLELWDVLTENPGMTATQALQIVQERGVLMSPAVGNLQTGAYGPMTEREIDLIAHIGGGQWLIEQLGDMPQELIDVGGAYTVEYDAPINKAMRAEEGVAISQTLEQATATAAVDPRALKPFKVEEMMRGLAEIRGVPAKYMYTEDEIAEQDAKDQQSAMLEQAVQAAPLIGGAAKDFAQANAAAGASPSMLPAGLAA